MIDSEQIFFKHPKCGRIIEHPDINCTIGWDKNYNFLLRVEPDLGSRGLFYFKLYNSYNRMTATKFARIDFTRPAYIKYGFPRKKAKWILDNDNKKALVEFLGRQSACDSRYTVWRYMIVRFNVEKEAWDGSDKLIPLNLPMPNYLLLGK